MTSPLLTALRQSYPHAHLTWLVDQPNVQAIDANPYVDEVIVWDDTQWKMLRSTRPRHWIKNLFGFRWLASAARLKYLLYHRFNIFISFHPEQGLLLLRSVGPQISIGVFHTIRGMKRDYRPHYTKAYMKADTPVHQTDRNMLPLEALKLPPPADKQMIMGYTTEDAEAVYQLLVDWAIEPGFVVLVPKTTWLSKCWPEERWSALGDALAQNNKQVVLIGSKTEAEAIQRVASGMQSRPVTLAGLLTFRQAAALIARASLCVSSDSGPMHVAAAVGTPYLSLFGPTPATRYAPLVGKGLALMHPVPCGPCRETVCLNPPETQMQCMRLLTVSEVLKAALLALSNHSATP